MKNQTDNNRKYNQTRHISSLIQSAPQNLMPRTIKHREAITNRVPFTVDTDGPNNNQPPHQDPSSITYNNRRIP